MNVTLSIGLAIINGTVKYYVLGIHDHTPEHPEYTEVGTVRKFMHLVIMVAITGLYVKKVLL